MAQKQQHSDETRTYEVTITRQDASQARAATRGHTLTLNVKKGDGAAGFNAAETLLAALGTCLLTNLASFAAKMRLQVDEMTVEFSATRQEDPPSLVDVRYRLTLRSPAPYAKLQELHELAIKWGTVSYTLRLGLVPAGELVVEPPLG